MNYKARRSGQRLSLWLCHPRAQWRHGVVKQLLASRSSRTCYWLL